MSDHSKQKSNPKGILKTSASIDEKPSISEQRKASLKDDIRWDEMNILATLHPENKDYGHIKVDEPKTPYPYDMEIQKLNPDELASSLAHAVPAHTSQQAHKKQSSDDSDDEDEEIHHDPAFESKRRAHYNEYQAVKLAKSLLSHEVPVVVENPEQVPPADEEDRRLREAALNAKRNAEQQKQVSRKSDESKHNPQQSKRPSGGPY